jgi:hypothetical protein
VVEEPGVDVVGELRGITAQVLEISHEVMLSNVNYTILPMARNRMQLTLSAESERVMLQGSYSNLSGHQKDPMVVAEEGLVSPGHPSWCKPRRIIAET